MEAYKIIAGFSDIKTELIEKTRMAKALPELQLWFSIEDDVLYVHDYSNHEMSIVLAIYNSALKCWTVYLRKNSYGEQLISEMVQTYDKAKILDKLRVRYKLYGFAPFNRG